MKPLNLSQRKRIWLRGVVSAGLAATAAALLWLFLIQPRVATQASAALRSSRAEFEQIALEELRTNSAEACRLKPAEPESAQLVSGLRDFELSRTDRRRLQKLSPTSMSKEDLEFLDTLAGGHPELFHGSPVPLGPEAPVGPDIELEMESDLRLLDASRVVWLRALRSSDSASGSQELRSAILWLAQLDKVYDSIPFERRIMRRRTLELLADLLRELAMRATTTAELEGLPLPSNTPPAFSTYVICTALEGRADIEQELSAFTSQAPGWRQASARAVAMAAEVGNLDAIAEAIRESRTGPIPYANDERIRRALRRHPWSIRSGVAAGYIPTGVFMSTITSGPLRQEAILAVMTRAFEARREGLRRGAYPASEAGKSPLMVRTADGPIPLRAELLADGSFRVALTALAEAAGEGGGTPKVRTLLDWTLPPL